MWNPNLDVQFKYPGPVAAQVETSRFINWSIAHVAWLLHVAPMEKSPGFTSGIPRPYQQPQFQLPGVLFAELWHEILPTPGGKLPQATSQAASWRRPGLWRQITKQIHSCSIHLDATEQIAHYSIHLCMRLFEARCDTLHLSFGEHACQNHLNPLPNSFTPCFTHLARSQTFLSTSPDISSAFKRLADFWWVITCWSRIVFSSENADGYCRVEDGRVVVRQGKTKEGKDTSGSRLHVFVGNRHGDLFSLALDEVMCSPIRGSHWRTYRHYDLNGTSDMTTTLNSVLWSTEQFF